MLLSLGAEFNLFKIVFIRGGFFDNIIEPSNPGPGFSFGFGFNIVVVKVDIGFMVSKLRTIKILDENGQEKESFPFPQQLRAEVSILVEF